jgi:hypothetical protein
MSRRAARPQAQRNGARRAPVVNGVPHLPMFSAERPQSMWSGLEPAFLLLESDLMERLRRKAAAAGTTYDFLLKAILRDHIDEY